MRGYKSALLLAIAVTIVLSVAAVTAIYSSNNAQQQRDKKPKAEDKLSKLPVVDFESPEPSALDKSAKRHTKNKTYNSSSSNKHRNPILTAERGAFRTEWDFGLESALPANQSSSVIVGEVTDAKAYLSEDKYNVYSEFTIRVDEVIKTDSVEPIAVGDSSVVDRLGGRVRQPTGHIASFYVSGQGVPEIGKRYVFFLGFNQRESRGVTDPHVMNSHILTAYELRSGNVFPLDSSGAKDFENYEGLDETTFLDQIRQSITVSPQKSPE